MRFTIIKSCLARFSGTLAVGTPSNIHSTAISYCCAKFGAFVNSVTILTLKDLTNNRISTLGARSRGKSGVAKALGLIGRTLRDQLHFWF